MFCPNGLGQKLGDAHQFFVYFPYLLPLQVNGVGGFGYCLYLLVTYERNILI